ncbi:DUF3667 domain-containing protein [uncultured Eudoraea sp.]|uniref:DUF3667 domain-containing protein n=1 Tax=uncultured Eudoraea sp. TaxID=1035614 RepID=UPI00261802ED|nr:DUF3667 domain-containing protein [uncultured Eudoraea sp.]
MTSDSKYCKNCGAITKDSFCAHCGQRTSVYKVSFKETIHDFMDAAFSVNAPLFITLKLLLVNPGIVLREYLEGKRKKYYKPVAFFILTTVAYLLIRSAIGFDPFSDTVVVVEDTQDGQLLTKARDFMLFNIDKLLFFFPFTLALFSKLFFYKKYTLAEFLAVSFYLTGMYTLFTTLNMFLVVWGKKELQPLGMLVMLVYFIYSMVSFIQTKRIATILKSILVFILSYISYVAISYGLSYLIVLFQNS